MPNSMALVVVLMLVVVLVSNARTHGAGGCSGTGAVAGAQCWRARRWCVFVCWCTMPEIMAGVVVFVLVRVRNDGDHDSDGRPCVNYGAGARWQRACLTML